MKKAKKHRRKRRIKTRERRKWISKRFWIDTHHLIPKSHGGAGTPKNLLRMKRFRHEAWHILFDLPYKQCRTLDEVIELLIRIRRAKLNQHKK